MIPAIAYTPGWIEEQRQILGRCDPQLLERCVHALALLGHLQDSELSFLFKGGTSLLLHLPQIQRLSVDIDIVCGQGIDRVVEGISRQAPFLRFQEDQRGERGLPNRRHFKFYYRSVLAGNPELYVLLDVVEEARVVHETVRRPIRAPFLEPEREVLVTVPTVESLLADKLVAFAPRTLGVPFVQINGQEQREQVVKQLFDVGLLFNEAQDFDQVVRVYDAICALESSYRAQPHSRNAVLDDTVQACLALASNRPAVRARFPDADQLADGFRKLRGHLVRPTTEDDTRRIASRAAVLATYLRGGRAYDFGVNRYSGSPEQLQEIRGSTFSGTSYDWLDRLRGTNPEAYFYWWQALSIVTPPT